MLKKFLLLFSLSATFYSLFSSDISVEISPNNSMIIKGKQVEISKMSDVIAVVPPWRGERINSRCEFAITREGNKVSSVQTGGKEFDDIALDEYSATVDGKNIEINLAITMKNDVPTKMFYQMLMIPDYLLTGASYSATLTNGEVVNGVISDQPMLKKPPIDAAKLNHIDEDISTVEFTSHYGKLSVKVLEGPSLAFMDRRENSVYNPIRGFEIGARWDIEFGDKIVSKVAVTFEEAPLTPVEPLTITDSPNATKIDLANLATKIAPDYSQVPAPREIKKLNGLYHVRPGVNVVFAQNNISTKDIKRLQDAAQRILSSNFPELNIFEQTRGNSAQINITINDDEKLPKSNDGYIIEVGSRDIFITARTPRGAFYALHTLNMQVANGSIPQQIITDYPDYEYRGIHLLLDDASLKVSGEMIEHLFAPLKINNLVVECQYVKWDSTTDIHQPWGMSKAEVIELSKIAEANFMEFTPLFQTLGHSEWLFAFGKNLDLAEDISFPYAYNQTNPRLYPLMDSILEEILVTFNHPKKLHIGHDEVFNKAAEWPCRPENIEKGAANIFYDDTMHYYEFAQEHDMDIMLWHDMLVTAEECPENGAGGEPYFTAALRDKLPKDIYLTFWRYTAGHPFTDIDKVYDEGFTNIIGATWYDLTNITDMTSYGRDKLEGFLQTTWTGYNGNATAVRDQFMQIHPYAFLAISSWNSYLKGKDIDSPTIYCNLMEAVRPQNDGAGYTIDISEFANVSFAPESNAFMADTVYGLENLAMPIEDVGGIKFRIPEYQGAPAAITVNSILAPNHDEQSTIIPVNELANQLFFLHSTISAMGQFKEEIASYQVTYEDGSEVNVPIRFGIDIGSLFSEVNFDLAPLHSLSWSNEKGLTHRLWYQTWSNPNPDKTIKSVQLISNKTKTPIYWFGLSVTK